MLKLAGSVAFITGGGRGIGRAIAQRFARAGAKVVVAARSRDQVESVAREVQQEGGSAHFAICDVISAESVRAAVDAAVERFGPVDILVNNAGYVEGAPLVRLDETLWHRTLAVNLTGPYLCTRVVLPGMIERRRGRIINIASIAARKGMAYTSAYCAAKHGVLGFTRAVALEVAHKGITVNAICPGWVDTEMAGAAIQRIVEKTGRDTEKARRTLEEMNPMRRFVQPEEVAAVALFLASDEASAITGQAYNIDGGEVMS
jgi:3-hydroxybutyrate dehydrogenase